MSISRQKNIFEYIGQKGFASAEELSNILNISPVTIRRDFIKMEKQQLLQKVHGGATILKSAVFSPPYSWRLSQNMKQKREIAQYAVSLIKNYETIFIDVGSTCYYLAKILPENKSLRIITHSHENIAVLKNKAGIELICPGGELDTSIGAYIGHIAERNLKDFFVDKCFLGAAYININQGCVNNKISEVPIKKLMYAQSKENFFLVDSSKFGIKGFCVSIGISDFKATIITDKSLPKAQKALFQKKRIKLVIV